MHNIGVTTFITGKMTLVRLCIFAQISKDTGLVLCDRGNRHTTHASTTKIQKLEMHSFYREVIFSYHIARQHKNTTPFIIFSMLLS